MLHRKLSSDVRTEKGKEAMSVTARTDEITERLKLKASVSM
jgi:hypothetical protein